MGREGVVLVAGGRCPGPFEGFALTVYDPSLNPRRCGVKAKLVLGVSFVLAVVSTMRLHASEAVGKSKTQDQAETPRNVELTNAAWEAFRNHKYEDAMSAADRCINRF